MVSEYGGGGREINALTVSLGVGIDLTTFLTRHIGFHVSADFYFPQRMNGTQSELGIKTPINYKLQDVWDSDWGVSVLAGPSFALLRTPRILFALAPGFHWYLLFAEQGRDSVFQYALGVGANAEFMLRVCHDVFLRAAVDVTYDFWGNEEYFSGLWTYSKINRAINVTPQVGIRFEF